MQRKVCRRVLLGILLLLAGGLGCLIAAGMGHREVRHPLMTIVHEPESEYIADPDQPAEAEADAENEG